MSIAILLLAAWPQFGRDPAHTSAAQTIAQPLQIVQASVVMDPFVASEIAAAGEDLRVHYAAPLIDGDDVFVEVKSGAYKPDDWSTQRWGVQALRWNGNRLEPRWTAFSDWQPPMFTANGGPMFEPVFQPVLANGFVYMPGGGGSVLRLHRDNGAMERFGPAPLDNATVVSGPLVVDAAGNILFNVIAFSRSGDPWSTDILDAWIERIAPDGSSVRVPYATIVAGAPAAADTCRSVFPASDLPWPPSPTAVPPNIQCGSQRPGLNVAPAIGADGTIYTISRAHFNSRYGYLVALNPDLTPKWTRSLRDRLNDGCGVSLPPNGSPGGCRDGAFTGVDPADNTTGAGTVTDNSSSSPLIAPDGSVFYGAYTRYNYSQGHLMHFSAAGSYLGAYPFGWDETPGIFAHDGTYTLIAKENRYAAGTYCDIAQFCPPVRPAAYVIIGLDPSLSVQWSVEAPRGFEWCINSPAIDARGVAYINSEDGWLYAISRDGRLVQEIQVTDAQGQAYTPVAIDDRGRVYGEKAGTLFVVGVGRRRAVRR